MQARQIQQRLNELAAEVHALADVAADLVRQQAADGHELCSLRTSLAMSVDAREKLACERDVLMMKNEELNDELESSHVDYLRLDSMHVELLAKHDKVMAENSELRDRLEQAEKQLMSWPHNMREEIEAEGAVVDASLPDEPAEQALADSTPERTTTPARYRLWRKWGGGERPVGADCTVIVRLRHGKAKPFPVLAGALDWRHDAGALYPASFEIVAYCLADDPIRS
jgi:predicted nuclease with TOPRIM domain